MLIRVKPLRICNNLYNNALPQRTVTCFQVKPLHYSLESSRQFIKTMANHYPALCSVETYMTNASSPASSEPVQLMFMVKIFGKCKKG